MKAKFVLVLPLLVLAACETNKQDSTAVKAQAKQDVKTVEGNAERQSMRVANNMRDSIKRTSMKIREWALTPLPEEIPTAVPSSYCYKVLQDIVCYRQPIAGWEYRLVGYQGTGAKAPAAAQTEPLPSRKTEKVASLSPTTTSTLESAQANAPETNDGARRAAHARPVFGNIPEEKKVDEPNSVESLGEGNEPLPNPTQSPQL
jgi:hypothetical protein